MYTTINLGGRIVESTDTHADIFSIILPFNSIHIEMSARAPYIVPALKKHTATVIMAHGLGDR